jgi:heptosyltransferase-1
MPEPRFLVVRLGSLGDIIHTFPAVAALRESFPESRIVWLTHPRWAFLVQSSGLASEIWSVETRKMASLREVIHRVRQNSWSAAIDYQGLWKSAMLPFFGGVTRRIGFSSATIREFGVPILYSERVSSSNTHVVEQNGDLSVRAGSQRSAGRVSLQIPEQDRASICSQLRTQGLQRYVVLSPGGGWRSKCWPADCFGVLARKLGDAGLRCVVNMGPGDEDLAAALVSSSGNSEPLVLGSSLGELMALLRGAACVVGGDTGPLHLAAALDTPVVALFGPTDPARNGLYYSSGDDAWSGGKSIVLRAAGVRTTHARDSQTHPSMLAISVDEVFAAVCRNLGVAR